MAIMNFEKRRELGAAFGDGKRTARVEAAAFFGLVMIGVIRCGMPS
jgi:hypothetical protein